MVGRQSSSPLVSRSFGSVSRAFCFLTDGICKTAKAMDDSICLHRLATDDDNYSSLLLPPTVASRIGQPSRLSTREASSCLVGAQQIPVATKKELLDQQIYLSRKRILGDGCNNDEAPDAHYDEKERNQKYRFRSRVQDTIQGETPAHHITFLRQPTFQTRTWLFILVLVLICHFHRIELHQQPASTPSILIAAQSSSSTIKIYLKNHSIPVRTISSLPRITSSRMIAANIAQYSFNRLVGPITASFGTSLLHSYLMLIVDNFQFFNQSCNYFSVVHPFP